MHTVSSPPVAYLLFVIGLALILFELFTAGVGVAGLVGAGCAGARLLRPRRATDQPDRGGAPAPGRCFGYGVDVQTGVPRLWSAIATVSFILGSLVLYDGAVAVVDHPPGGDRRDGTGDDRRHAGHGPHPLLHPDHRP